MTNPMKLKPDCSDEFWQGYLDGRDKNCPEPSENRSHSYRHSFEVGRAELANKPLNAAMSRERAIVALTKDAGL